VTISAQLADAAGTPVATANQVVTWSKTGAGGSFATATSSTNANGIATIVFTTSTSAGVTYTFTANDANERSGTSGNVLTIPGAPAKYLVSSSNPTPIAGTVVTVSAQLADLRAGRIDSTATWDGWRTVERLARRYGIDGVATVSFTTSPRRARHLITATTGNVVGMTSITTFAQARRRSRHYERVESGWRAGHHHRATRRPGGHAGSGGKSGRHADQDWRAGRSRPRRHNELEWRGYHRAHGHDVGVTYAFTATDASARRHETSPRRQAWRPS
jgi:hypothetical protein